MLSMHIVSINVWWFLIKKTQLLCKKTNLSVCVCLSVSTCTRWNFVFTECASSCCRIAEGRPPPTYCVWQGQNQSACLQETHAKLLPSLGAFARSHLCPSAAAKVDQPQDIWASEAPFFKSSLPNSWQESIFCSVIDDWLIIANKDVGLLSFKLEWFNLTVMRFLQDVISNRRRQRDWTNPWPLICSGSRQPVIPVMVLPAISALFPAVGTEKLRVFLKEKVICVLFAGQVKMWKCKQLQQHSFCLCHHHLSTI